jgi:hypothetical protein
VSYWICKSEKYGYAHNSIGAYLDDGGINARSLAGDMITDVVPQVSSTFIAGDTLYWVKVEGSFTALGGETHITLGNFALQEDVDTFFHYWGYPQYSYYYFDDVSVVRMGTVANAGPDRNGEAGRYTTIGPVEDTTARGMDCKWYHRGMLVDSGNVITVLAPSIVGVADTYVVEQVLCGVISRDTMVLHAVPVGIGEEDLKPLAYYLHPNPNGGSFKLCGAEGIADLKVYNAVGTPVYMQNGLSFEGGCAFVDMGSGIPGVYLACITTPVGETVCLKFMLE